MSVAAQKAIAVRLAAHADTSSYTVVDNQRVEPPYIQLGTSDRDRSPVSGIVAFDDFETVTVVARDEDGLLHKEMAENVITAIESSVLDLTGDDYKTSCEARCVSDFSYSRLDEREGRLIRYTQMRFQLLTQRV